MHLIETKEGSAMRETALSPAPFGAGFALAQVAKAAKLEVHGSSFTDSGPDFCLFKLLDENGNVVGERKINGY